MQGETNACINEYSVPDVQISVPGATVETETYMLGSRT